MTKEEVYDTKISPLISEIVETRERHNIPLASFQLGSITIAVTTRTESDDALLAAFSTIRNIRPRK